MYWAALGCNELYFQRGQGCPGGQGGPCDLVDPGNSGDSGDPGVKVVSLDDVASENIWFSVSKPTNYRGKLKFHACDGRTNGRRKVENSVLN